MLTKKSFLLGIQDQHSSTTGQLIGPTLAIRPFPCGLVAWQDGRFPVSIGEHQIDGIDGLFFAPRWCETCNRWWPGSDTKMSLDPRSFKRLQAAEESPQKSSQQTSGTMRAAHGSLLQLGVSKSDPTLTPWVERVPMTCFGSAKDLRYHYREHHRTKDCCEHQGTS